MAGREGTARADARPKYLPAAEVQGQLAALSARLTGEGTFHARAGLVQDATDPATARKRLGEVLAAARLAAGQPKLATLGRQIGYHESMLSRVMKGRVTPTRDKLVSLAEQFDVSSGTFQAVWLPLWEAARRKPESTAEPDPADPARPSGAPDGFTCPTCGAWVTDGRRHMEWHMTAENWPKLASVTPLRPVQ